MPARERVGFVQRGEVRCGEGGDVVGLQGGGVSAEGAADDLLDLAAVEIDAWAEAGHCGARCFGYEDYSVR